MKPLISVVMPVYNGEKYLRESIKSILNQTFKDFELIIINDGSTDQTEEIIKSYGDKRIVYINNGSNLGLSRSFNIGIGVASGAYLARMDADDISLSERFEKQLAFLALNQEVSLIGSAIWRINEKGDKLGISRKPLEPQTLKWQSLFSTPIFHPTVMARAHILKENLFNESLTNSEDYELWSRLIFEKGYKLANLPNPLLMYRVFPNSFTKKLSRDKRVNSINNSLRNIERYFTLSRNEQELLIKAFTGKPSIRESFQILSLYRKIRNNFITKESFTPSLKPFIVNLLKRLLK